MKDNLIMKILLVILNIIIYDTIGFIFQDFNLIPDLNIYENLSSFI